MLRTHLIVIGSGWGGLKVVRALKDVSPQKLRITLISDTASFRYSAALYRAATGRREREAIIPISEVLSDLPNVDFVKAKVTKIDTATRSIKTTGGKIFHYDYAVFALGSVTNYFGIPGLSNWSYSIKSAPELRALRTHLHQTLIDNNSTDKNYVIVGGGPTGVELAAALTSYMRLVAKKHKLKRRRVVVSIVEAAPRILPASKPAVSKRVKKRLRKLGVKVMTNQKVESEDDNYLFASGHKIPTQTVIWTAGVANSPFFANNSSQFHFSPKGRVIVDDHLRIDSSVYVIGDNAETPFTGLGQTAVHNGSYVARDIKKRLKGKQKTSRYRPLTPATVIPVGRRWAVLQYRNLIVTGILGAFMRSLADLVAYGDILGWRKGFKAWVNSEQNEEKCLICKTSLKDE